MKKELCDNIVKKILKGAYMRSVISLIIVFLFGIFVVSAYAAMYKWVDEKGHTWITDYPSPKAAQKHAKEAEKEKAQTQTEDSAVAEKKEIEQEDQKNDVGNLFKLPEDIRKKMQAFHQVNDMPVAWGPLMAMMSGFLVIILIVVIAACIYFSLCLYLIAKKLDVSNPWVAWIPIANLLTVAAAAGKEWWWAGMLLGLGVLSVVPLAGIIFEIACLGVWIYLWMCITESLGRNKWLGILIIVPLVHLVWLGILAFSKQERGFYPPDLTAGQG
jgi:hypothetical protein